MAFGPIDLVVVEFRHTDLNPGIITNLVELVSYEVVRILDLVIVWKDEQGRVNVRELDELSQAEFQMLEPLRAEISGMITDGDIQVAGKKLMQGTTAAIMLMENLWVTRLKQDVSDGGGRLVMHERIPSDVVAEALKDLEEYD